MKLSKIRLYHFVATSLALTQCIHTGNAQVAQQPYYIVADSLINNTKTATTTARGNVEINIGDSTIKADMISYDQKNGFLTASGNITLVQADGIVIESNYMDLNTKLSQGQFQNMRALLLNQAQIATQSATRKADGTTVFENAIYTPCTLCENKPQGEPLWQIKATKITNDPIGQNVEYNNAWLEMFGIPVAYTPYFIHPSPTVKKRSGLLYPSTGSSSRLGRFVKTPYYYDIAPDQDMIITPIYMSRQGVMTEIEHRKHITKGTIQSTLSYIGNDKFHKQDPKRRIPVDRWHLKSVAEYHLTPEWRISANINRVSDSHYFRQYRFFGNTTATRLKSDITAERFTGRNYLTVNGSTYQDLRVTDKDNTITPKALPQASFWHYLPQDPIGGRFKVYGSWRTLMVKKQSDNQRASVGVEYFLPYIANNGVKSDITVNARQDYYYTDYRVKKDQYGTPVKDGSVTRQYYSLAVKSSYPMHRTNTWGRQLIEPIVGAVISPKNPNKRTIDNNDSTLITIDETNLFNANRSAGLDRTEGGKRSIYGLRLANYGLEEGKYSLFVGQSIRQKKDVKIARETGAERKKSDYVGHLIISPNRFADFEYRYHVDAKDKETNLAESSFLLGPDYMKFGGRYTEIRKRSKEQNAIRQIELNLQNQYDEFWRSSVYTTRDLLKQSKTLKSGAIITYEDECFQLDLSYSRDFTHTNGIRQGDRMMFEFKFKTLATYKTQNFKLSETQYQKKKKQ